MSGILSIGGSKGTAMALSLLAYLSWTRGVIVGVSECMRKRDHRTYKTLGKLYTPVPQCLNIYSDDLFLVLLLLTTWTKVPVCYDIDEGAI